MKRRSRESRFVTVTGRTIATGRITRASHAVSGKHDGKPLPLHLQCHPPALTPTSHNPACLKMRRQHVGLALRLPYTMEQILNGEGLERQGRYALQTCGNPALPATTHYQHRVIGYTDDVILGLAYKRKAATRYVWLEVIDNEGEAP